MTNYIEVGNGHIAHLGNIGQSNQIAAAFGIKVMLFSLLLTVKYQSASKHSQRSQTVSIDYKPSTTSYYRYASLFPIQIAKIQLTIPVKYRFHIIQL